MVNLKRVGYIFTLYKTQILDSLLFHWRNQKKIRSAKLLRYQGLYSEQALRVGNTADCKVKEGWTNVIFTHIGKSRGLDQFQKLSTDQNKGTEEHLTNRAYCRLFLHAISKFKIVALFLKLYQLSRFLNTLIWRGLTF